MRLWGAALEGEKQKKLRGGEDPVPPGLSTEGLWQRKVSAAKEALGEIVPTTEEDATKPKPA